MPLVNLIGNIATPIYQYCYIIRSGAYYKAIEKGPKIDGAVGSIYEGPDEPQDQNWSSPEPDKSMEKVGADEDGWNSQRALEPDNNDGGREVQDVQNHNEAVAGGNVEPRI